MKSAAVLMQRNEGKLLLAWTEFHASLFGYENLYVFDNGSTDHETLQILNLISERGVGIDTRFYTQSDFKLKGDILRDKISNLQNEGYSFVFPLDCDEFIGVMGDDKAVKFSKNVLEDCLQPLLQQEGYFSIMGSFFNASGGIDRFQYYSARTGGTKVFFGRSKIKTLDYGLHNASVYDSNDPVFYSNLIHIHLHNRAYHIRKILATQKLRTRVKNFSPGNMKVYRQSGGAHLRSAFLNEESGMFNKGEIFIPSFKEYFESNNIFFSFQQFENSRPDLDNILTKISSHKTSQESSQIQDKTLCLIVKDLEDCSACLIYDGLYSDMISIQLNSIIKSKFCFVKAMLSVDERNHIDQVAGYLFAREDIFINDINCLIELVKPGAFKVVCSLFFALRTCFESVPDGQPILLIVENERSFLAAVVAALSGVSTSLRLSVPNFWSQSKYHFLSTFYSIVDTTEDSVIMHIDRLENKSFVSSSLDLKYLTPFVVNILRDVALKGELDGNTINLNRRIDLMRLAHFGRPEGPLIKQKLSNWLNQISDN